MKYVGAALVTVGNWFVGYFIFSQIVPIKTTKAFFAMPQAVIAGALGFALAVWGLHLVHLDGLLPKKVDSLEE